MNFDKICIGIVCEGGYYKFGTQDKILTDKTIDIPEGTYIKSDFTPLKHQEVADFFGMTLKDWTTFWLKSWGLNIPLVECWKIVDELSKEKP
jgi:hypothetical protein